MLQKRYHISRGKEIKRKHVLPCNSGDLSHIPVAYERKINVAILFFYKFIKTILSQIIMRTLRELPVLPWKPDIHLSCDAGKQDCCVSRLQLTVNYEMLMLAYRLSYFLSAGQRFFVFPCWRRLLSSANNPCKQFGSRSGPTERRSSSQGWGYSYCFSIHVRRFGPSIYFLPPKTSGIKAYPKIFEILATPKSNPFIKDPKMHKMTLKPVQFCGDPSNIQKIFIPPKIFTFLKTHKILKFKIFYPPPPQIGPSVHIYENIRVPPDPCR